MSDSIQAVNDGYPLSGGSHYATDDTAKKLMNLWGHMKTIRQPWDEVGEEIAQYMLPRHSLFTWDRGQRGERRRKTVYDATGIRTLDTVADGVCGYSIPQNGRWFDFTLADTRLLELPGVRQFLQESTEQMALELDRSTFYSAMRQAVPIDVGLGTVTQYFEEDVADESTFIETLHNKEVWIHEDRKGNVNTWVRKVFLPLDQLIDRYGEEKLPKDIVRRAKDHPLDEEAVIIFVMPRTIRDVTSMDSKDKPWASYHILERNQQMLKEGGYDTAPFNTHRWTYMADEVYGRGWGHDVLTDVLRLNQVMKSLIRAAQLAVDPPVLYPPNMRAALDLEPGAKIPQAGPQGPQKIDLLGQYPITKDLLQELRQSVHDHMMYDFFISLQQMRGSRTATEVLEMQGEKAAVLGTIISSLHNDLYTPAMARVYMHAIKQRRMPEVPESLVREGGLASLKVNFTGPLAQIAKRFHAHQGMTQTLSGLMPMAQMWPEVLDVVDPHELGRYYLDENGFPQKAIRDKDEIQKLIEQRQAQIAAQQQMEQLESVGKAAPGIAKAQDVANGISPAAGSNPNGLG